MSKTSNSMTIRTKVIKSYLRNFYTKFFFELTFEFDYVAIDLFEVQKLSFFFVSINGVNDLLLSMDSARDLRGSYRDTLREEAFPNSFKILHFFRISDFVAELSIFVG